MCNITHFAYTTSYSMFSVFDFMRQEIYLFNIRTHRAFLDSLSHPITQPRYTPPTTSPPLHPNRSAPRWPRARWKSLT